MSRSKPRRSRRNKSNSALNFQRLEPRKMLAGLPLPAGVNLIVNGDFENFTNDETQNV